MNEVLMKAAEIITSDKARDIEVCSRLLQVLYSKREQLDNARKMAEANGYNNTTLGLILGGLTNVYLSNSPKSEIILQREHIEIIMDAMDRILKEVIDNQETKLAKMVDEYKEALR